MRKLRFATLSLVLVSACSFSDGDSSYRAAERGNSPGGKVAPGTSVPVPDAPTDPASGFIATKDHPISTFASDVDTGSYTYARALLANSAPIPSAVVRAEEWLNYFDYGDAPPADASPLAIHLEGAPSPFGANLSLLRVALKAKVVSEAERAPVNLVFLVDVSGSMGSEDKLPLVKYALEQLVEKLRPTDTLGIVTYAGGAGTLLSPTPVTDKANILSKIASLGAAGGTNGQAGIQQAYALAEAARIPGTESRVVLCTDGDLNIGATGEELFKLIDEKRATGITLATLGFGVDGYNDNTLEQLADRGNGVYSFVDSQKEADHVVGDRLVSTIQLVAKDTKIQVVFDPNVIRLYRLIGYENRALENEDFTDDAKDAGDIGAGHTMVALYEVEYETGASLTADLATVKVRYKLPTGDASLELSQPFSAASVVSNFSQASEALRFGAAVTELAEIMGHSQFTEGAKFSDVTNIANNANAGAVPERSEFIGLISAAQKLYEP